jgi:hypothetical protein
MIKELYKLSQEIQTLERMANRTAMERLVAEFEAQNEGFHTHNNLQVEDGDLYVILHTENGELKAPKSENEYPCDEILSDIFAYRVKTNGTIDREYRREVYTEKCDRDSDLDEGYYYSWCVGDRVKEDENGN